MPKNTISVRFLSDLTAYTTDIGIDISTSAVFNAPPDLTDANIDTIVTAIGGTLTGELPPCREFVGSIRKLQFIRRSGNTMSVPVGSRANLINAATTIRNLLNAANSGNNKVVCIKLIGEEFPNLNDELGLSYTNGTFAKTHRAPDTATKQYVYSGKIEYSSDATNPLGGVRFQAVKAISDNENAAATQLGTTWAGCVGDFQSITPCPTGNRRNPLKHRRYELSFLSKSQEVADPDNPPDGIEAEFASEQIEVPVKASSASDIKTCGENLAGLTGVYCIGYRGESYSRFHRLLAS